MYRGRAGREAASRTARLRAGPRGRTTMRRSLTGALSAGALIGVTLAPAAAFASTTAVTHSAAAQSRAGGDPNTTMTFTVTVGGLTMTAPGAANIGSGAPGTTISGPLGTVPVTDAPPLLSSP